MAKFIGLVGTGRGKAGNFVFSKGPDGSTTVRAYQPQVNNPKSLAQVKQRSKMNTAGRFSRLFSASNLTPMGGTKLSRRSRFNSNLLQNMRVRTNDNVAYIIPELVKFSNGALPTVCSVDYDESTKDFVCTMPANSGDRNVRFFVYFNPAAEDDIPAQAFVVDHAFTDSTSAQTFAVHNPYAAMNPEETSYTYVWAVEWVPTDENASQKYTALVAADADTPGLSATTIAAQWENLLSNSGVWTDTALKSAIDYFAG